MITVLDVVALPAFAALYVNTFNAPPWGEAWTLDDAAQRLGDFLATPRARGVVAHDEEGELVGFALGHLERVEADDHFLLQEMCVRGDARRQGHGTRLLAALSERLEPDTPWYLLTARDSEASAFYGRNGFRPAGRQGVFVRP